MSQLFFNSCNYIDVGKVSGRPLIAPHGVDRHAPLWYNQHNLFSFISEYDGNITITLDSLPDFSFLG